MLFAYPLITAKNLSAGMDVPFTYVNEVTHGVFGNMLLFSVWCIFVLGMFFIQKRNYGTADLPACFAVGSYVTFVFAIILRLLPSGEYPIVTGTAIAICLVVSIIGTLWLLLDKSN